MHACPSCGSALDASQPPPPFCPYCGASLTPDSIGPGAPPGFAGHPGETTEAPIFGMPGESSAELARPSLEAPVRRQPPPAPPMPGQVSGPPSIGLDDSPHNEFDLGEPSGSGSLELDYRAGPAGAAPPPSTRPPASQPPPPVSLPEDSGIDYPAPVGMSAGESGLDLPSPVGIRPSQVREDSSPYALDLPVPVNSDQVQPKAPSGRTASGSSPAMTPPVFAPPSPAPGPPPAGPPPTSSPLGAPPPFSQDLLAPRAPDLPAPLGPGQPDESLELPLPTDLLTPGAPEQRVAPTAADVAPSNLQVEPSNLQVEPSNLQVEPSNLQVEPRGEPSLPPPISGTSAQEPSPARDAAQAAATRSPAPAGGRPPVSRGLLLAVGGLALVGLAGVGVLYSGILDPDEPEPTAVRGGLKPSSKANGSGGATPSNDGPAVERSSAVLATMASHTPTAYLEARGASTKAGDAIGAAECDLLLHFHYGPNPPLEAEAATVLQPYADASEPFVRRVLGLRALAAGRLTEAEPALAGDGPRTRLYRGWLRLAQDRLDEADVEAEAVLGTLPDEMSARHLALAVAARRDPSAALVAIRSALERTQHPALHALLASVAIETGELAIARTAVEALDSTKTDDPGVRAWVQVQRARVRMAQGDHAEAVAALDRALERIPNADAIKIERIRALMKAKRVNEASAAVSVLVRERPNDLQAQLLQAEVSVYSGDGDIALTLLEKLAKAMPEDPRASRLRGQVHAMRLEVDEGQKAFAAARAVDPLDYQAAIAEAVLLADAKRLPAALTVLETARTKAEAAERPRDVADLLVAKAKLHLASGERNAVQEALDRALDAVPTHNEAQRMRGVLRLDSGQVTQGRADLVEVFERTGGYPGLAEPLGRLFVREGNFEAIERLVGDRLQEERTPTHLLNIGIRLRLHQGQLEAAQSLIELALARRPSDWEAHMLKARLLIEKGDVAEALTEIDLSRPLEPQPERMLQRGKILEFNGRHDDAIPEYRRALELDPDLHEARFLFGRLLHHKGGHGKAITELRKVLDAPSAKTTAWFPEVWLNIGLAQQAQGKYADAIASLKKATEIDPTLGQAWTRMGIFHENLNRHAEAIAALTTAVELGTRDDFWYADALMNLGRAQAKSGQGAAAKKSLREFLEVASPESTSRIEAERLLRSL